MDTEFLASTVTSGVLMLALPVAGMALSILGVGAVFIRYGAAAEAVELWLLRCQSAS